MLGQIPLVCSSIVTNLASVRFLAGVGSPVSGQIAFVVATILTKVASAMIVEVRSNCETGARSKRLEMVAHDIRKGLFASVGPNVLGHGGLFDGSVRALRAREWLLALVPPPVRIEHRLVSSGVAAQAAGEWLLSCVPPHVSGQVAFLGCGVLTKLARVHHHGDSAAIPGSD